MLVLLFDGAVLVEEGVDGLVLEGDAFDEGLVGLYCV